jgi:opacity protein-like surface antigen
MDRRHVAFPNLFCGNALPLVGAVVGCALGAALATGAAAQQPEIRFDKLNPATALPASADTLTTGAASELDAQKDAQKIVPPPAPPGPRLTPHVGLDVGGSGATLDALSRPPPGAVQSYDPDRHYRAQAGVDYDVNSKIQLGLGYRYSNFERPDLVLAPAPDTELESQQRDQAARFTLRYKFGGS